MIKLNNVSHQTDGKALFTDLNVSLDGGKRKRIALIGENGAGKSTLLKVMTGDIRPAQGTVERFGETIGYLPQNLELPAGRLVGEHLESRLAEPWMDYLIDSALRQVGLGPDFVLREIDSLSGGERVRLALAAILISEPTVLLLDEPTNHLDKAGVGWLEEYIRQFAGTVLFVSHDRQLLNNVCDQIWELDPETHGLNVYSGDYDAFLEQKGRLLEKRLREYQLGQRELRATEQWLKAHEFNSKFRFSSIVYSKKRRLKRLEEEQTERPRVRPAIKMADLESDRRGLVLSVDLKGKRLGERTLLSGVSFKMHRDDRVWLTGPNGSGKTSLLNVIARLDDDYDGSVQLGDRVSVGYLKQFTEMNEGQSVLAEFERLTGMVEPHSRSALAGFLFPADSIRNRIGSLSYGERRRLDLAIIIARKPNLLLLDEPTNHLDTYRREELESFIVRQDIPMVIVSHDRYFLNKIEFTQEVAV